MGLTACTWRCAGAPMPDRVLPIQPRRGTGVTVGAESLATALSQVMKAALVAVEDATDAGICLVNPDGRRVGYAASSSIAAAAEGLQHAAGQGPCLSAWASGDPVVVEHVTADARWPEWSTAVESLGLRSCVSVPLLSGGLAFGALGVYWNRPQLAAPRVIQRLRTLAGTASVLLVALQARETAALPVGPLAHALTERALVGRAKRLIMARLSVDDGRAMRHLLDKAVSENLTLREIAHCVITDSPMLRTKG